MLICSCKKTVLNVSEQDKDVFNPALKNDILRMIEVKNKKESFNSKICNVVVMQDSEDDKKCIVIIGLGTNIVQPIMRFTPPSDSLGSQFNNTAVIGYTFLENELIGCCILSDLCNNGLINEKELIPIKDSIPGYPNALNRNSNLNYDAPMRMYQIINADSLQLIDSVFIPNL